MAHVEEPKAIHVGAVTVAVNMATVETQLRTVERVVKASLDNVPPNQVPQSFLLPKSPLPLK